MVFAEVIKKKNKDFWLVVQKLRLEDGNVTSGEIVFQGAGSIEIARHIRQCLEACQSLAPVTEPRPYPILAALGYKHYASLRRETHVMNLSQHKFGLVRGWASLGSKESCPFSLTVDLMAFGSLPKEDRLLEDAWSKIQQFFAYAEQYKV